MITPCQQGVTPVTPTYADEATTLFSTDIVAYWKMEAESGNEPDYSLAPYGGKPLVPVTTGGIYAVIGALPAAQDDGAFRYGVGFSATDAGPPSRWAFAGNLSFSAAFFLRPREMGLVGDEVPVVGTQVFLASPPQKGWGVSLLRANSGFGDGSGPVPYFMREGGAYTASPSAVPPAPAIPFNAWTHIVVTYDGTTLRQYHDGALVATIASAVVQTSEPTIYVFAGTFTAGTPATLTADIDEVIVIKREVTAGEVASLYAASL